jgi:hypothetical protein
MYAKALMESCRAYSQAVHCEKLQQKTLGNVDWLARRCQGRRGRRRERCCERLDGGDDGTKSVGDQKQPKYGHAAQLLRRYSQHSDDSYTSSLIHFLPQL